MLDANRRPTTTTEERETLDPAGVLDDMESVEELDAEIARVRAREERLALRRLHKAEYFGVRFTNGEFAELFPQAFLDLPRRPSTLSRLERRRDARYADRRARDARRKAVLGGFVVVQCRQKPEVHAAMVPDIREWLLTHRSAEVGEKNVAALEGFFVNPADKGLSAPSRDTKKARTYRLADPARRMSAGVAREREGAWGSRSGRTGAVHRAGAAGRAQQGVADHPGGIDLFLFRPDNNKN